jgi:hypothetical protein
MPPAPTPPPAPPAYSVDPTKLAPQCLASLWVVVLSHLPPATATLVQQAVGLVGFAGLVAALCETQSIMNQVNSALMSAAQISTRTPAPWQSAGENICAASMQGGLPASAPVAPNPPAPPVTPKR